MAGSLHFKMISCTKHKGKCFTRLVVGVSFPIQCNASQLKCENCKLCLSNFPNAVHIDRELRNWKEKRVRKDL